MPVRLRGTGAADPCCAESILGPGVDPPMRRILAGAARGEPRDRLPAPLRTTPTARCGSSRRASRLSRDRPLPELWFLDLLHLPTETTAAYNLGRLRRAPRRAGALVRAAGERRGLRAAIREANRTRRCWRGSPSFDATRPRACRERCARCARRDDDAPCGRGECRLLEQLLAEAHPARAGPAAGVLTGSSQTRPTSTARSRATAR